MKYRDLIQFDPIESVIELRSADDHSKAEELVRSYVMSDNMAELISAKILSQLQLTHVVDNKGILLVGNYGTGKSHLMSVVSAVASDANMLALAQNEQFRKDAAEIAGKFEVLRIEIGSTTMSLRNIIVLNIEQDLKRRGISFKFPDVATITNNKDALTDMMAAFAEKYGDERGYLIVVDELLDYLRTRKDTELMTDLGFMRELGEIIKTTRFRFISGVQEALFDNAAFRQVSSSLLKMKDRFEQVLIRSEDIAYVAQKRVLHKSPEQRAMVREHLQKFCPLYQNMASRLEDYVDMFPIHPAYIDTFQHIVTVEKREVLKTISETIGAILDQNVTDMAPGIVSFDTYWKRIKENPSLRTDPAVHEVLPKVAMLESAIQNNFPKPAYKSLAMQIISALSVHRLTTVTLDAKLGLTEQALKDDLCLYIPLPVMEEDFLLGTIHTVMQDIINTVSGQFITYNGDNGQYYIDLSRVIDYDKKIQEKADFLGDDALDRHFFDIMVSTLNYSDTDKYVPGFNIFQYNLNWRDRNIFRRGYLFLGQSADRPSAEPKEDFWVYIVPPFSGPQKITGGQKDEVYFTLQADAKLLQLIRLYGGAREMEILSAAGETKTTYVQRGKQYLMQIRKWMDEHRTTLFKVTYMGVTKTLLEALKGTPRIGDLTLKDIVEIAASNSLHPYFHEKYPEYPRFASPVTVQNMATNRMEALNALVGKATQLGNSMLDSFGLRLDGKIRPENSPYAQYYIGKLKALPEGNVLNYSDIMTTENGDDYYDIRFRLNEVWMSVILTALVWAGACVLVDKNGKRYGAGNMEELKSASPEDIYKFKRLEKPKSMNRQMLMRLFDAYGISSGLLASESTYAAGLEALLKAAKDKLDAAWAMKNYLNKHYDLWGSTIIPMAKAEQLVEKITAVHTIGDDIRSRFTTVAKLKNFDYDDAKLKQLEDGLAAIQMGERVKQFREDLLDICKYIEMAETKLPEGCELRPAFAAQKKAYQDVQARLLDADWEGDETDDIVIALTELKKKYIEWYMAQHKAYRLDHAASTRKGTIQQSPTWKALTALKGISGILPTSQLTDLANQLTALKTCYEMTEPDLQKQADCPHCHFNPADNDGKPVHGRLGQIEDRADEVLAGWTGTLKSALEDPMLEEQKGLLGKNARAAIDKFLESGVLPMPVDQQFIQSVNAMLSGLESLEVHMDKLQSVMMSWGPCTPDDFKLKLSQWVDSQTVGKDKSKVRIVVK